MPSMTLATVRNTENNFFAGFRALLLLTYTDVLKENHGYSILFHAGVASCIYDLRVDS